jgi:hypothetical protein
MAFACVLPGPSGDDSHPGAGVAIPTSVDMRRSQQRRCERHRGFALQIAAGAEARSAVHPTTHLNALFGQFVEQQVAARRWEFSGRPWRPDNGSCRSSPLPPDTPRKPHGAAFIRLTPLRLRGVRLAIDCLNCHPIEIEPHVECDRAIARRVQAALRDARA